MARGNATLRGRLESLSLSEIVQTITLGRKPRTVVGIMPPGFRFLTVADFWVPFPPGAVKYYKERGWM